MRGAVREVKSLFLLCIYYHYLSHCCLSAFPSACNSLFHSGETFVMFYTEILYYSSVQNIQIVLISQKNIKHFTCELVLLLEATSISKYIANIFVQDFPFRRKGILFCRVRMQRLSPLWACPSISLFSICTSSIQATILSPVKPNMQRLVFRHD